MLYGGSRACPRPEAARHYWKLPDSARLRDVVIAVRNDEAEHRDINHRLRTASPSRGDRTPQPHYTGFTCSKHTGPAYRLGMYEFSQETRKISDILGEIAATAGERVRLRELVNALGDRAFGLLILIFALPNAVGLGTIPGLSTVFGVPQLFIAVQMALGWHKPWLPDWVLEKSLARTDFQRMVDKSSPYLKRAEKLLRPRWAFMSSYLAERLLGIVFAGLALIVALPIPGGNWPPAIAMAFISIGLVERDGLYITIGLGVAIIAALIAGAVIGAAAAAAYLAFIHLFGG